MKATIIEQNDAPIKTVESRFLPHHLMYHVVVAFASRQEAQDFVASIEPYEIDDIKLNPSVHVGVDSVVNSSITATGDGKLVATPDPEVAGSHSEAEDDWTQAGDGTEYPQSHVYSKNSAIIESDPEKEEYKVGDKVKLILSEEHIVEGSIHSVTPDPDIPSNSVLVVYEENNETCQLWVSRDMILHYDKEAQNGPHDDAAE